MNDNLQEVLHKLRSGTLEESIHAANNLIGFGEEAVDPLIQIIRDVNAINIWFLAADALGYIGDKRAVEPLIELLKTPLLLENEKRELRKHAADALAMLADPHLVDVLIKMLHERYHVEEEEEGGSITVYDEPAHATIAAAAEALAAIGEWRGIEAVINRLLEGDHWHDHRMGEWGGEQAFQLLLHAIKSENVVRRSTAATLLGQFRDQRVVEILIELLQSDPNDRVRENAAYGLSYLLHYPVDTPDTRSFTALVLALKDPSLYVRSVAEGGLRYFWVSSPDHPDRHQLDVATLIQKALNDLGEQDLVEILVAFSKTDRFPHQSTIPFIVVVAPFLSPESLNNDLIPILNGLTNSTDQRIRDAAQEALKRIAQ